MGSRRERGRIGLTALVAAAALLAIAGSRPAAGAVLPPEPPLAASSNVHLLGHIPGSAAGMNFKGHYAYVSGWTGVTVLDIAQPASPQLVGVLPLPHFENEDVDLCGNILLVVNDRAAQRPRLGHVRGQHREPDRCPWSSRCCRSA